MKRIMVITMAFVIVCGPAFVGSVSAQQPETSHAWVAWANVGLKANAKMTFKQHTIFLYLEGGPGSPRRSYFWLRWADGCYGKCVEQ